MVLALITAHEKRMIRTQPVSYIQTGCREKDPIQFICDNPQIKGLSARIIIIWLSRCNNYKQSKINFTWIIYYSPIKSINSFKNYSNAINCKQNLYFQLDKKKYMCQKEKKTKTALLKFLRNGSGFLTLDFKTNRVTSIS